MRQTQGSTRVRKNRSYEKGQQKKKACGQSNIADLKDKILREFSKGFPRDREMSHLRCDNHSRHVESQKQSEVVQEILDGLKKPMILCGCRSCK